MSDWPHAPLHRLRDKGTYIVTGATYQKALFFNTPERLDFLHDSLLSLSKEYGWALQVWAVMANHYHFVAKSPKIQKVLGH